MKKKFLFLAVAGMVLSSMTTPAFAHGSHHRRTAKTATTVSYSVCGLENCVISGRHTHNGVTYVSHYYGDGHKYHGYCDIDGCATTGYHGHDGVYGFGHTANDGHGGHH